MRQHVTFLIKVDNEKIARERAMQWYAKRKFLTVDSVKPYSKGGYVVSISYDVAEDKK